MNIRIQLIGLNIGNNKQIVRKRKPQKTNKRKAKPNPIWEEIKKMFIKISGTLILLFIKHWFN